ERAGTLIGERRAVPDRLASARLERETLDRDEVEMVVAGKPLPPQVPPPAPVTPHPAPEGAQTKEKTAARGPVLGSPPPEPAGAESPFSRSRFQALPWRMLPTPPSYALTAPLHPPGCAGGSP